MGKSIIFWQSIISPHQVPYLKHLPVLNPSFKYVLVVPEVTQAVRNKLGWEKQHLEGFELAVNPDINKIKEFTSDTAAIHIFEGIRGFPLGWKAFKLAVRTRESKKIVLSEAPDLRGRKRNLLRRFATIFIERWYRKHIDLVLCIGQNARDWYQWCGYKNNKLKSFCYVVEDSKEKYRKVEGNYPKFLFVGSLIPLKGIERLLKSMSELDTDYELTIIGNGVLRKELMDLSQALGIQDKVEFKGILPNKEVRQLLNQYDFLVLPSYYDGWGAVVNEALMEGVGIIVSDACGSSDIVKYNSDLGYVFDSNNEKSLFESLSSAVESCQHFREKKLNRKEWAEKKISGKVLANYFHLNLEYLKKDNPEHKTLYIPYKKH